MTSLNTTDCPYNLYIYQAIFLICPEEDIPDVARLSFGNDHAALIKAARTVVVEYIKHTATMAAAVTQESRLELEQPNSPTLARARQLSQRCAERYDEAEKSSRHSICGPLEKELVVSSARQNSNCNMTLLFQRLPEQKQRRTNGRGSRRLTMHALHTPTSSATIASE